MSRPLPGTAALQAFESAAALGSISAAARELHLTQGAVSRQIQALEQHLDTRLFHRERQRIRLTQAGERYLQHVRAAFDRLETAELELRTLHRGGGVLQLGILPTYGTRWLIPRFPSFAEAQPDVQVHFTTKLQPFDFASTDLDAAIHHGDPHWPGARLDHLMDEDVVLVCSPEYRRRLPLETPSDLRRATLLQMATRPNAFPEWLASRGLAGFDGRRGPRFEHHQMVLQAAIAGLGVAVLPTFACTEELDLGRIVEAFPDSRLRTGRAYWLAYPEARQDLPALQAFRRWLLEQHGRPAPTQ
ncbi:MAG: LysR substrate-binding domain-containing protein [Planctomycetota bacterium]